jgi:hypothetical protein
MAINRGTRAGAVMMIDVVLVARHGTMLSLVGSTVIMGALRLNPRLFLRHFPATVRASQPPLTSGETAVRWVVGLILIALFVGAPIWSARAAAAAHAYTRWDVFLHAFLVGTIFNLVDWLILDELWIGRGRPRWALPPGVSEAEVPFDHAQHARGFVTGSALFAFVGVIAALVVSH